MELAEFNRNQEKYLNNYLPSMPDNWKNRSLKQYLTYFTEEYLEEVSLKLKTSKSILDIGCGFGYALPEILENAQDGATVVGVDIDLKTVKQAIARLRWEVKTRKIPSCDIIKTSDAEGIPTKLWKAETTSKKLVLYQTDAKLMLKCKPERFDLILSLHACRYFIDKAAALLRMLAVLRQGGDAYLLIDVDGILVLDWAPDVELLHTAQDKLLSNPDLNTLDLIQNTFKNSGYRLYDTYTFSKEYLSGLELDKPQWKDGSAFLNRAATAFLKIHKKQNVSPKGKLPEYHSFLINPHQNYKTISIYVKK